MPHHSSELKCDCYITVYIHTTSASTPTNTLYKRLQDVIMGKLNLTIPIHL